VRQKRVSCLQAGIPNVTENLDFRLSQSLGDDRSQLARISNTGDVEIEPSARAFASAQNQVFSHVGYRVFKLLLIGLLFSCSKQASKQEELVEVETVIVQAKTIPIAFEFVGVCQSSHLVEIRSRVQGYLEKVAYVEGAFVQEGDLLFKIDDREFQTRVNESKANLEKEKAILWSAQKAVDRYQPLFEQKAASRKDLDDATAQLLAEQAQVNFYEAKLQEAELNLEYTSITSPISGLTTNSRYQEGTLITPQANDLLTTVSVIDPIWVTVSVSDYYFLESNQEIARGELIVPSNYDFDVSLTLADGSIYPYPGRVNFVSPVLNPNTGTLSARAIFDNPDALLKPGQFVRARVTGAKKPNAILVPQSAVVQGENSRFVYVLNGNVVEKRDIVTGTWYENDWIIKSGLKSGDEVIVLGVNKVKEGTKVRVINRPRKK